MPCSCVCVCVYLRVVLELSATKFTLEPKAETESLTHSRLNKINENENELVTPAEGVTRLDKRYKNGFVGEVK